MADAADIAYPPHPQRASLLCWAAATQVVADVLNHPIEQPTIAAYAWFLPTQLPDFTDKVKACEVSMAQFCNRVHVPILDDLGFTYLKSSALPTRYLSESLLTADIEAGRPIIFGWRYDNSHANGVHFMVIVGFYHTKTSGKLKLHIYDPLPVGAGNAQTVSFDNYAVNTPIDLHNDMGLPYDFSESYYNIEASPVPPMPPGGLSVEGGAGDAPEPPPAAPRPDTRPLELRQAIEASRSAADAEIARRESDEGIRMSAGFPLPLVALGLGALRSASAHTVLDLLRPDTGTVLYPIESGERVRDSFLMIKRGDEWVAGGYANTTVTRRLVTLRQRHAHRAAERAGHFVLSVPALGAFFLAHGSGSDTRLIPVTDDHSIKVGEHPLQANKPYRADQLLPALAQVARSVQSGAHGERSQR